LGAFDGNVYDHWYPIDEVPNYGMSPVWQPDDEIDPQPDFSFNDEAEEFRMAIAHSRYTSTSPDHMEDPHPFVYGLSLLRYGNRVVGMAHNGGIEGSENLDIREAFVDMIGWNYWDYEENQNWPFPGLWYLDERLYADHNDSYLRYNGQEGVQDVIDSELYGMLLIRNLVTASYYQLTMDYEAFAIQYTINQLQNYADYDDDFTFTSLNILFTNGEDIYAVVKNRNSTQWNTHKIWYSEEGNNVCFASANNGALLPDDYFEDGWTSINTNNTYSAGQFVRVNQDGDYLDAFGEQCEEDEEQIEIEDPSWDIPPMVCAVDNPNQEWFPVNPRVALRANRGFIAAWETTDESASLCNIEGVYLNRVGLWDCSPFNMVTDATNILDQPYIAVDAEKNDYYLVYTETNPSSSATSIKLRKFDYDDEEDEWTPKSITTIFSDANFEVSNPCVAVNNEVVIVNWTQEDKSANTIVTKAYAEWDGGSMSTRTVGAPPVASSQKYPDILYIGDDGNDPLFVISQTQNIVSVLSEYGGVYMSLVSPKTIGGAPITASLIDTVDTEIFSIRSALALTDTFIICSYGHEYSASVSKVMSMRITAPDDDNPIPKWYEPAETLAIDIDTEDYILMPDVSNAGRADGYFDVVYSLGDKSEDDESQVWVAEYPNIGGTPPTPEMLENLSPANETPSIAISVDPEEETEDIRVILWAAAETEETYGVSGIAENYYPPHFPTSSQKAAPRFHDQEDNALPDGFVLHKVYPNPFNSTARIKFDLSKTSEIKLDIFDIQGRSVMTLADGNYQQGSHELVFNADKLPSGIYFYRLKSGSLEKVEKAILIK